MGSWRAEINKLIYDDLFKNKEKINELIKKNGPKSLYKYKPINEYTISSIKNDQIWLTPPTCFNDPYDCVLFANNKKIIEEKSQELLKSDCPRKITTMVYDDLKDNAKDINPNEYLDNPLVRKNLVNILNQNNKAKDVCYKAFDKSIEIVKNYKEEIKNINITFEDRTNSNTENIDNIFNKIHFSDIINMLSEKEEVNSLVQHEFDNLRDEFAIFCLSERNDNILMWSHYADRHSGICLEYECDKINNLILPVIYSNNIIDLSEDILNDNYSAIFKGALIKANDWIYEKEWRILHKNLNIGGDGFLIKFPRVKSIYLGCNVNKNDKATITELANEKGIDLYQMKMKKDKFELIYEKVN